MHESSASASLVIRVAGNKKMSKRLFVGSLAWGTTEATLKKHFEQAGAVESAAVIMDKMSGRSKGFGFVDMEKVEDAEKAIKDLDGKESGGRKVVVNFAKPKEDKPRREGGFRKDGFRREGGLPPRNI